MAKSRMVDPFLIAVFLQDGVDVFKYYLLILLRCFF